MSLSERFFNLYRGLDRAVGRNEVLEKLDAKNKRASKNSTVHTAYVQEKWDTHLSGAEGLGVIPITDFATCSWGAIDIDTYPLDLHALEEQVKSFGFPFVILRSKSGGAHITVYFKNMEPCTKVRSKLTEIAYILGLGEREIYPKQVKLANEKDVGNWLNMPYFGCTSTETERYAIINGQPASVEDFLDFAEKIQLDDIDGLVIPSADGILLDGPPCLQKMIQNKAGPGERNNVLFNLGVYARLKYESSWEQEIENFNRNVIDPPLSHREVGAIVKSLEKKNYAYTCNNPPICNHCNREACKNRDFGIIAFQHVDVGIVLDSISKMMSEPPMWVLSLEGVRTEVETEELLDQNKFRRVCVDAINKIPGRMKAEEWDKFIRNKLTDIEILDMPLETRELDLAATLVPRFFETTPEARSVHEMNMGRWVKDLGAFFVRGIDFQNFLLRQSMDIDMRKFWSLLLSKGVMIADYHGVQSWRIPEEAMLIDETRLKKYNLPPREHSAHF